MQLRNPFSLNTRNLFLYVYSCFLCRRSDRGLELHHIVGRDSNSAFNACPLCTVCHAIMKHTQEEERELFFIVFKFLFTEKYKPDENDYSFLKKYWDRLVTQEVVEYLNKI